MNTNSLHLVKLIVIGQLKWLWDLAFSVASIMEEQILAELLGVHSSLPAMIMMLLLTNTVEPTINAILNIQAHVFKYKAGVCAAFLANYNPRAYASVAFQDKHYNLPPWSISILPDCRNTVYNTARVGAQIARKKMVPVPMHGGFSWQAYTEGIASDADSSFTMVGLLEQINATDYLCVKIDSNEGFLRNGKSPVLTVLSAGHALHVFVNGQLSGSSYGSLESPKLTFSQGVNLSAGINKISLLSIAVGLPNVGPHFETWNAGVLGPVTLNGLNKGRRDLSWQKWSLFLSY
ncbi:hypothetical protein V6N13_015821 [Hibiscus sabdariffa]